MSELLTRPIYAGYIEVEKWSIPIRKGQHEGLNSFETHRKILERLAGRPLAAARANLGEHFALRGFVTCGHCGSSLYSCWSTGRYARYPYYICQKRHCAAYGKSIKRDVLEGEFAALLKGLEPSPHLLGAAQAMFRDIWDHFRANREAESELWKKESANIDRQVDLILDRLAKAELPSVIKAYEDRVKSLEMRKVECMEKIANCGRPMRNFDEASRTAFEFLANPWKLWVSGERDQQRTVLKLAFTDRLAYVKNEGFRTAHLSFPFQYLADISGAKNGMVRSRGLEPPRCYSPPPQGGASTNSATSALKRFPEARAARSRSGAPR